MAPLLNICPRVDIILPGTTDVYGFIGTRWGFFFIVTSVTAARANIAALLSSFFLANILLSSKEAHGLTGGESSMSSEYPEVPISYFLRCREFTVAGDQTAGCAGGELGSGGKVNER